MKFRLVELTRWHKVAIVVLLDFMLCCTSTFLALGIRLDMWGIPTAEQFIVSLIVFLNTSLCSFISRLYFSSYRYFGGKTVKIFFNVFLANVVSLSILIFLIGLPSIPRSIAFLQPLIFLFLTIISRVLIREYLIGQFFLNGERGKNSNKNKRILIYGAGSAGRQLAAGLDISKEAQVLGYVDGDSLLQGSILNGVPVFSPKSLDYILAKYRIDEILLAIPSITPAERSKICLDLIGHGVKVRTLPGLSEVALGRVNLRSLRELEISDLLGRPPVAPEASLMDEKIKGRRVLITGGGGSIGSELARQVANLKPKKIMILDVSEFALYQITQELNSLMLTGKLNHEVEIVSIVGSIQDQALINRTFKEYKPDTVFHAAAYKHVPIVELNWIEGIKNNIFGTLNCVKASLTNGVSNFILISSDKAVRPTNIMGATKRFAELILQAYAHQSLFQIDGCHRTCFAMVRFGNVLGSSGSVVPLFYNQIKNGGPVTVTDPRVTRYFMTIEEAAQLVIQASSLAKGGDVFLLDMGEPILIRDLAEKMIRLSGFSVKETDFPGGDIEIIFSGLRPGEKLYEELLIDSKSEFTANPKIRKASESHLTLEDLYLELKALQSGVENNDLNHVRLVFERVIEGYCPSL